ncbi:hypothetical protein [Streptomyces clavuligerus]|nr:hypothetical protein [Streptomyces clavuligerus]EDY49190.1 hypothetical protein SSCG_02218 [Streptomyces clavuligerus]
MGLFKELGVGLAAAATALAVVSPASASARQEVTLSSPDGYYSGSIVRGANSLTAKGLIGDYGNHNSGGTNLSVTVYTSTGSYNIDFAAVVDNGSYTFGNRKKTYPGTFISATAILCSWQSSSLVCGPSQPVG